MSARRHDCSVWDEIDVDVDVAEDDPAARTTVPAFAAHVALAVGLGIDALEEFARSSGRPVIFVGTHDGAAAADLLAVLRPSLALVGPSVSAAECARLREVAAACGVNLIVVQSPSTSLSVVPHRGADTEVARRRMSVSALATFALPPKESA